MGPLQNIYALFSQSLRGILSTVLFGQLASLGKVMAVTVVLLVVGVGALFFLLSCLRGFSRAGKQEKVMGLFVRAQGAGGADRKTGKPPECRRSRSEIRDTTLARQPISKNTAAVVGLAILLGSRSTSFAIPMSALASHHSEDKIPAQKDLPTGERLRHHS